MSNNNALASGDHVDEEDANLPRSLWAISLEHRSTEIREHCNRADPSHDNVEPEATLIPTAQNQHAPSEDGAGNESRYDSVKVKLHQAALKGDWKAAKEIFDSNSSAVTMRITVHEETALHIAASEGHISFVENLVNELITNNDDLAAKSKIGNTALAYAAASGVVEIARVMVNRNPNLPNLPNGRQVFPVLTAVGFNRKHMASFLYDNTNFEALHITQQTLLLTATILADYYDIALKIVKHKPELAVERLENGDTALYALARNPYAIGSSNKLGFWKKHINSRFNRIYNKALMQTLAHQTVEHAWEYVVKNLSTSQLLEFIKTPSSLVHEAARVGNAEFLIIVIGSYPDLLRILTVKEDKSIFHVAVENRQERVFSLVYELGGLKDFLVNFTNGNENMLHLAGTLASPNHLSRVTGAALQMQRELLWFKEVEKIVMPPHRWMRSSIREPSPVLKVIRDPDDIKKKQFEQVLKSGEAERLNINQASSCLLRTMPDLFQVKIVKDPVDRLTPRELFSKEHKQLLKSGEEWMKTTANSCMLVATLIATVVFAAAFTVPGGNDDKEGVPIFRQNKMFTVFVIADGAGLVLSITSILTFLSILTSRYAEDDFLVSLPRKLLIGILTLSLSMGCMVVAFGATFFIAYDKTKTKIPYVIAVAAVGLPIWCFHAFFTKLVVDILRSVYWPQFSLRRRNRRLF